MFTAKIIRGAGRGKTLGYPTLNLALEDIPDGLEEGIYAVRARVGESETLLPAVMHYGARPVFEDTRSCEIHILGKIPNSQFPIPNILTVEVVQWLREVRDFESEESLKEQIAKDIAKAQTLLH